jgi:hypothetical protein
MRRAVLTGRNALARLAPDRSDHPRMFWVEVTVIFALGIAVIYQGAQLLGGI